MEGRVTQVTQWLRIFLAPGQVAECRAIYGRQRARCSFHGTAQDLARRCVELDSAPDERYGTLPVGVYFTPNPLRPDLIGSQRSATKADVLERSWLLIDCDPKKPAADTSSTEAERSASWDVLRRAQGACEAAGFVRAVIADSGNGFHLCYPIRLASDDASQALVKAVLVGLNQRCGDDLASVDTKPFDAPRIWKAYGTRSRKGEATPDRPHRYSKLIEGEMPRDEDREANNAAVRWLLHVWEHQDRAYNGRPGAPLSEHDRVIERTRLYLRKVPPAISGQAGHNACFTATMALVEGFALSTEADYLAAIADWNASCQPPWSPAELRHKFESALAKVDPAKKGHLLNGTAGAAPPEQFVFGTSSYIEEVPNTNPQGARAYTFKPPLPASQLQAPEAASWLWEGFLARGGITLMSALWKAGKTTLITRLMKVMETGGDCCGQFTESCRVLCITEESEGRWAARRDKLLLADNVEFLIRPFAGKPSMEVWRQFLGYLKGLVKERVYDVIIFDPLSNLWPVKDENDAAGVQAALMPLHDLIKREAIFLVHHNRKGDGTEATAARGSGALTAFVDTIIEFRRFAPDDRKDRRRVLTSYGRDEETPEELVIELTDLGDYEVRGTKQEAKAVDFKAVFLQILPAAEPGATWKEVMEKWPERAGRPNRNRLFEFLTKGVDEGWWHRTGKGVRGDPHRYRKDPVEGEVPL